MFAEQRAKGFAVWREEFDQLRIPKLFNLRRDPFERADENADNYEDWWVRKVAPRIAIARIELQMFLTSLAQFPPRQRPATFGVDQMIEPLYNLQKEQAP